MYLKILSGGGDVKTKNQSTPGKNKKENKHDRFRSLHGEVDVFAPHCPPKMKR